MASSASASAIFLSTSAASLQGQDDEIPTIQFTNARDLFQLIDRIPGDVLVVTNVSPRDLTQIEREREIHRSAVRFRRYNTNSGILIVTIPTGVHEVLHRQLMRQCESQISGRLTWIPLGATTFRAQGGHPGGDSAESDSCGGPYPARSGANKWPTLVIEAGYSESLEMLHVSMRWWFSISDYKVKIVLLVKFNHSRQEIIVEKWDEEELAPSRPGATSTRWATTLQPTLRQRITITRNETTDPVSYNVAGGALVLEFRLLFLRDPSLGEEDIVFTRQDLEEYAELVWNQVQD